jgi:uncharacterized membrane protein YraQ (UPF0718 family)
MDINNIASSVKKFMPLLASVISAENPIAGLIIMAISNKFGVSSDPSQIINAINSDSNAAAKLNQIENEHKEAILKYQNADHASAREREETIIKLTGKRDWILDVITILVVVGFFILCILNYYVDLEDDHIVTMFIGQLSSGFMLCLSYYFGSSNK